LAPDIDINSSNEDTMTSQSHGDLRVQERLKIIFTFIVSSCLIVEKRLQNRLTQFPLVLHQDTKRNNEICSLLSAILLRKMRPSLFIGTRSILNLTFLSLKIGPKSRRFRENVTISFDGATIALDWEIPSNENISLEDIKRKLPIRCPVVLILHGIYTDTTHGYIREIMHSITGQGFVALGMNFRGCGGTNLSTPRMLNAAYTNDLRAIVNMISSRLAPGTPLLIIGYSLGGNILVKYLGESGVAGSLPKNMIGAASIANPFKIDDAKRREPWNSILRIGAKKAMFLQRNSLKKMTCPNFQRNYRSAQSITSTLPEMNSLLSPYYIRNNSNHPFETKIGYTEAREYWQDASSHKYIAHVNVPLLIVYASDDDIASKNTTQYMNFCLSNPNVIVVNTATGGHLGWHHASRNSPFGSFSLNPKKEESKSWCNKLVAKFVDVIIKREFYQEIAARKMLDRRILINKAFEEAKIIKSQI